MAYDDENIKTLVDAIDGCIDDADLCCYGCGALKNMTNNNGRNK